MLRRTVVSVGAALAVLTILSVPAVAVGGVPAGVHQQAAFRGMADDAPAGWILRDKYWTHGGCVEAGTDGVQRHHWDEYQCANGSLQWVLWTNR